VRVNNFPALAGLREIEELFGHRWDALVLLCLVASPSPLRYRDLAREMHRQSDEMFSDTDLSRSLRRLADAGLIQRSPSDDRYKPYALTSAGARQAARLTSILNALSAKGATPVTDTPSSAGHPPTSAKGEEDAGRWKSRGIDIAVAHPARRYDYWLGGKDNFAADRESGDAVAAAFPTVRTAAIENRRFLGRAVSFLTREVGLRQFLDIGPGLPSANNTHEVAQAIAPESRIVYVDNDPLVLAHARALLTSMPEGTTAYIDADLRDQDSILTHPDLRGTLDLSRPVGLMLVAILHFVKDEDDPYRAVARLISAMPSGSYLTISHATNDHMPQETSAAVNAVDNRTRVPFQFRSRDEFRRFLDGLDIVSPGVVSVAEWRADNEEQPRPTAAETAVYGAVARIP
jgi:DNA-binding HxlR family transcriptional regulator